MPKQPQEPQPGLPEEPQPDSSNAPQEQPAVEQEGQDNTLPAEEGVEDKTDTVSSGGPLDDAPADTEEASPAEPTEEDSVQTPEHHPSEHPEPTDASAPSLDKDHSNVHEHQDNSTADQTATSQDDQSQTPSSFYKSKTPLLNDKEWKTVAYGLLAFILLLLAFIAGFASGSNHTGKYYCSSYTYGYGYDGQHSSYDPATTICFKHKGGSHEQPNIQGRPETRQTPTEREDFPGGVQRPWSETR